MTNAASIDRARLLSPAEIRKKVGEMGQWFHNINLKGVQTAPDHFLGDYPNVKWQRFEHVIPRDLEGMSVLDAGCNAGFYSIQMKLRGAGRVLGIDYDDLYLEQARFAAAVKGLDIEFRNLSVYRVAELREKFDIVLFMGVLYHLRHPLLALDLLRQFAVKDIFVFQSMLRGSGEIEDLEEDYSFSEADVFEGRAFPRMHFIEKKYSGDPTNWWIPNRACAEAMLRSAGFRILEHPEKEVYVCGRAEPDSSAHGCIPSWLTGGRDD